MPDKLNYSEYYPVCIYTMKRKAQLDDAFISKEEVRFTENKIWRSGYNHFIKASQKGLDMLILFSSAEDENGIIYIGKLINIRINPESSQTTYSFNMLFRLENPKPLSSLQLLSTNEPLSNNYIRPYAIIKLPDDLNIWINEIGLSSIVPERLSGNESFSFNNVTLSRSLLNFWQWSSSDLINNALRGVLAEYIVASALNIDTGVREEWKAYDLDYKNLRIEVKSSAYIQSWDQNKYSSISFSIKRTLAYDEINNEVIKNRKSDIYVFCLLVHKIQETINPLNLNQWRFYIIKTDTLNSNLGNAQSIGLAKLKSLNPITCDYDKIKYSIDSIAERKY